MNISNFVTCYARR